MTRAIQILFRRDTSKDRQDERADFDGYQIFWPDGRPVQAGLDAFCKHGRRLLGLGRRSEDVLEQAVELVCFPLRGREDDLTRLPGHRVRRFFLERHGRQGRIHFLDGTPTAAVFDVGRDEHRVLHWIGLNTLLDGERQWMDLAARAVELPAGSIHVANSLHGPDFE